MVMMVTKFNITLRYHFRYNFIVYMFIVKNYLFIWLIVKENIIYLKN